MRPPTEAAPIPRVAIWILPRRLDHPLALLARSALQGQMVRRRREDRAAQRAPAHLYHLSDQADRPALQSSQRVLSKKRAQLLSPYAYLVPSPSPPGYPYRLPKRTRSIDKARQVFAAAARHRPRNRLTIRQRTRVLEEWGRNAAQFQRRQTCWRTVNQRYFRDLYPPFNWEALCAPILFVPLWCITPQRNWRADWAPGLPLHDLSGLQQATLC